ncbi:MAG: hypothetical protein KGJ28_12960 [Alphaproteobacteria bacterium]|nr:hypothetical protein [Alphaproteobacteria bacterium]
MRRNQGRMQPTPVVLGAATALFLGLATAGLAHGGGAGMGAGMGAGAGMGPTGAGMSGSMGAGGMSAGGMSGPHGNFGGDSDTHMSAQGLAHSNGPNATDRDFGTAHAQMQMNAEGLKHSKAGLHAKAATDTDNDADNTTPPSTGSTPQ